MIAYFDTSALVPLLVDEPGSELASRAWTEAARVVSSRLCVSELHAAVAAAVRSGRLPGEATEHRGHADDVLQQLTHLGVDDELVGSAAALAWRHGLRGYDAVHLATALRAPTEVVLAGDGPLLSAAASEGLAVVDTSQESEGHP